MVGSGSSVSPTRCRARISGRAELATLVTSLVARGDCIDDVDRLRAGSTAKVVGHDTVAASNEYDTLIWPR